MKIDEADTPYEPPLTDEMDLDEIPPLDLGATMGAAVHSLNMHDSGPVGEGDDEGITGRRSDESVGDGMSAMTVSGAGGGAAKGGEGTWEDPPDKMGVRAAVAETVAAKKDFANARKQHYNMKEAMQRARQLLDEEDDDDEK